MSKLNDRRVAIAKRIMEVKDAHALDAIAKFLDGRAHLAFTEEEVKGFEAILEAHKARDGRSVPWPVLRKRLTKELPVRA